MSTDESGAGGRPARPVTYEIGTIVNGHVWTGVGWAPVRNPGDSAGLTPNDPIRRSRGNWFRPKMVFGVWAALILIVLVMGFIPNATVQMIVSIAWFFTLLIALPATLIALMLWLVGVGARNG